METISDCRLLLGSVLLLDPRKWSREPKKVLQERELDSRLLSLSSAYALPKESGQSRFWFHRIEVRLRLFPTSSTAKPVSLGIDQQ